MFYPWRPIEETLERRVREENGEDPSGRGADAEVVSQLRCALGQAECREQRQLEVLQELREGLDTFATCTYNALTDFLCNGLDEFDTYAKRKQQFFSSCVVGLNQGSASRLAAMLLDVGGREADLKERSEKLVARHRQLTQSSTRQQQQLQQKAEELASAAEELQKAQAEARRLADELRRTRETVATLEHANKVAEARVEKMAALASDNAHLQGECEALKKALDEMNSVHTAEKTALEKKYEEELASVKKAASEEVAGWKEKCETTDNSLKAAQEQCCVAQADISKLTEIVQSLELQLEQLRTKEANRQQGMTSREVQAVLSCAEAATSCTLLADELLLLASHAGRRR